MNAEILQSMTDTLWHHATRTQHAARAVARHRVDVAPAAARKAAEDLYRLYVELNGAAEMKRAISESIGGGIMGHVMATAALSDASKQKVTDTYGIAVPYFECRLEDDELVWQGDAGRKPSVQKINPARRTRSLGHEEMIAEAASLLIAVADDSGKSLVDVIANMERYILKETKVGGNGVRGRRRYAQAYGRLVEVDQSPER